MNSGREQIHQGGAGPSGNFSLEDVKVWGGWRKREVVENDLLCSGHVKNVISDTSVQYVGEERSTHNRTEF